MKFILRTSHLMKSIHGKEVVSNVSINVKKGEIYGFLGPNGSGKTTIMKMISNRMNPTSGEIKLFGKILKIDSFELMERIGSSIEYPIFNEELKAKENLELHCGFMVYHDENAIKESLKLVNLQGIDDKAVKDLSPEMKQRLSIARAISTKPEFINFR